MSSYRFPCAPQAHVDMLNQPMDNQFIKSETVEHQVVAGIYLWRLVRITAKQDCIRDLSPGFSSLFIFCHLLREMENPFDILGHPESERLGYYSCPLHFLDQAPARSGQWREGVRAFHRSMSCPKPGLSQSGTEAKG
jgi:hypothetical protein